MGVRQKGAGKGGRGGEGRDGGIQGKASFIL